METEYGAWNIIRLPAATFLYLVSNNSAPALFYGRALGTIETMRLRMGDKIGNAEMELAGERVMLACK